MILKHAHCSIYVYVLVLYICIYTYIQVHRGIYSIAWLYVCACVYGGVYIYMGGYIQVDLIMFVVFGHGCTLFALFRCAVGSLLWKPPGPLVCNGGGQRWCHDPSAPPPAESCAYAHAPYPISISLYIYICLSLSLHLPPHPHTHVCMLSRSCKLVCARARTHAHTQTTGALRWWGDMCTCVRGCVCAHMWCADQCAIFGIPTCRGVLKCVRAPSV